MAQSITATVFGLRELADYVDMHPDWFTAFRVHVDIFKTDIQELVQINQSDPSTKLVAKDGYFNIRRELSPTVSVDFTMSIEAAVKCLGEDIAAAAWKAAINATPKIAD